MTSQPAGGAPGPQMLADVVRRLTDAAGLGPVGVSVALADGSADGLLPGEAALSLGMVQARRCEFAAGRRCARQALRDVGGPGLPILVGALREPLWPKGFTGSIAHDGRFIVAVAMPAGTGCRLGIDIIDRKNLGVFAEILEIVRHPDDLWVVGAGPAACARYFAAKEAAIKVISPVLGAFQDVQALRVWPAGGTMAVTSPHWPGSIKIRCSTVDGVILAIAGEDGAEA